MLDVRCLMLGVGCWVCNVMFYVILIGAGHPLYWKTKKPRNLWHLLSPYGSRSEASETK